MKNNIKHCIFQWIRIISPSLVFIGLKKLLKAVNGKIDLSVQSAILPEIMECAIMLIIVIILSLVYFRKSFLKHRSIPDLFRIVIVYLIIGAAAGWQISRFSGSAEPRLSDSALIFLTVCILGPACEEIVYRGLIYESVADAFGTVAAVTVSTLLFACGHGTMRQVIFSVPVGLLLGILRKKENDIIAPIILHCAINTVVFFQW